MPLRVGVMGVGAMGENHVRNYAQLEREGQSIQLIGVYDTNAARMKEISSKYRAPVFSSPDDLLAEAGAVSVCTPTTLHEESVLLALESGCHVLVEKPIASTLAQAERMAQAAKWSDKVLMVGHSERFNPAVFALKERVNRGELGEIVSIGVKRVGPHNPRIRDVGVIVDLGVHDIDVISYLYGARARKVFAVAGVRLHPFEDYASIALFFPPDKVGTIDTNWLTPKKVRALVAVGTKGVAELDYTTRELILYRDGGPMPVPVLSGEPLRREIEAFLQATETGVCPVDADQGAYALRVALAAQESARTGESVPIG